MMLKSVLADVMQQLLQLVNLDHANSAESIQRIVGKRALAYIPANHASGVVGREARKAHRPRLHSADHRSERVVLAHGSGDDLLEIHAHILEEMLGQVAAMEADGLVRIVSIVIV